MEKDISVAQDKDNLLTLTREVEEISVAVFASLLSSISLTPKSKGNGWSVASKLLKSRSTVDAKELGMINAEVNSCLEIDQAKTLVLYKSETY
ncbi:hypothetical protein NC651_004832 [Populus alba x Populus x berolinensis]|nr:hypothetical protein NC651_004832 [Populus alba x Populus x berolinensis]